MTDTPECDKLHTVVGESQTIGEFIEWLESGSRYNICVFDERRYSGSYWPMNRSIQQLLAEYFEIDLNKVEEEKRALLEMQREINKSTDLLAIMCAHGA